MLGKHHSEEWSKKHSDDIKIAAKNGAYKNMWNKNKHPKGMLGKHHSEEYKQHIKEIFKENHPSYKRTVIIFPDGKRKEYRSLKHLCEAINISAGLGIRIIKSNKPYKLSKCCNSKNLEYLKKIDGCIIKYIENTEVTS